MTSIYTDAEQRKTHIFTGYRGVPEKKKGYFRQTVLKLTGQDYLLRKDRLTEEQKEALACRRSENFRVIKRILGKKI